MANSLDAATLLSIAKNRNRLMRLAEGIKSRRKPGHNKKTLNLKRDPAYTNIEHLVFGTYRPRSSTPVPPLDRTANQSGKEAALQEEGSPRISDSTHPHVEDTRLEKQSSQLVPFGCECQKHSPRLKPSEGAAIDDVSHCDLVEIRRSPPEIIDDRYVEYSRPPLSTGASPEHFRSIVVVGEEGSPAQHPSNSPGGRNHTCSNGHWDRSDIYVKNGQTLPLKLASSSKLVSKVNSSTLDNSGKCRSPSQVEFKRGCRVDSLERNTSSNCVQDHVEHPSVGNGEHPFPSSRATTDSERHGSSARADEPPIVANVEGRHRRSSDSILCDGEVALFLEDLQNGDLVSENTEEMPPTSQYSQGKTMTDNRRTSHCVSPPSSNRDKSARQVRSVSRSNGLNHSKTPSTNTSQIYSSSAIKPRGRSGSIPSADGTKGEVSFPRTKSSFFPEKGNLEPSTNGTVTNSGVEEVKSLNNAKKLSTFDSKGPLNKTQRTAKTPPQTPCISSQKPYFERQRSYPSGIPRPKVHVKYSASSSKKTNSKTTGDVSTPSFSGISDSNCQNDSDSTTVTSAWADKEIHPSTSTVSSPFRKAASLSEKNKVRPLNMPVIRNSGGLQGIDKPIISNRTKPVIKPLKGRTGSVDRQISVESNKNSSQAERFQPSGRWSIRSSNPSLKTCGSKSNLLNIDQQTNLSSRSSLTSSRSSLNGSRSNLNKSNYKKNGFYNGQDSNNHLESKNLPSARLTPPQLLNGDSKGNFSKIPSTRSNVSSKKEITDNKKVDKFSDSDGFAQPGRSRSRINGIENQECSIEDRIDTSPSKGSKSILDYRKQGRGFKMNRGSRPPYRPRPSRSVSLEDSCLSRPTAEEPKQESEHESVDLCNNPLTNQQEEDYQFLPFSGDILEESIRKIEALSSSAKNCLAQSSENHSRDHIHKNGLIEFQNRVLHSTPDSSESFLSSPKKIVVNVSPSASPSRNGNSSTSPEKCIKIDGCLLWMSDIEEKDENSSSGTSRGTSEEPPDIRDRSGGSRRNGTPHPKAFLFEKYGLVGKYGRHSGSRTESLGLLPDIANRNEIGWQEVQEVDNESQPVLEPYVENFVHHSKSNNNHDLRNNEELNGTHPPKFINEERNAESGAIVAKLLDKKLRTSRLLQNKAFSRSERQLKASSSPEFRTNSSEEMVNIKDIHRPWSQIYGDLEANNFLRQSSSSSSSIASGQKFKSDSDGSQLLSSGDQSPPPDAVFGLSSRCSSLRTSNCRGSTDSVLQKFRKSFSLRFQRGKKCDIFQNGAANNKDSTTEQTIGDVIKEPSCDDNHPSASSSPSIPHRSVHKTKSGPATYREGETEEENGFKIGPLILRTSRERKKTKNGKDGASKCNSADSGIQVELAFGISDETADIHSENESPALVRRRAASTSESSPKVKPPNRPHSDSDGSVTGNMSLMEAFMNQLSKQKDCDPVLRRNSDVGQFGSLRKTPSVERQMSTPFFIKVRTEKSHPKIKRNRGKSRLRRSVSHPADLEKIGLIHRSSFNQDRDTSHETSTASSDDDESSLDGENYQNGISHGQPVFKELEDDGVTYAEALWDHVTIDNEELAFQAGEVIEVTDSSDKDWWWGSIGSSSGWFPAAFVRLRVSQEDTVEDCINKMADGTITRQAPCKMSVSLLSNEQVRANVVQEIVCTERDFVQHLKDVVEGYLRQVRHRPDMFSEECIATIFGNIEHIYAFQSRFLKKLESCIDQERPHLSEIGNCFLEYKMEFEIYSEYCNNHPLAVSELQELYAHQKYLQFFEACRLLQEMIDISLDGFLLTPVQKICKYPLQLAELLKYTKVDHPDHMPVADALAAMREVAQLVNERKRRMECLERLAEWQRNIDGWESPDILDTSSVLIHSGEVARVYSSWSREIHLFLFDHVLIYCKKDLLKRNTFVYKGRIDVDTSNVLDVEDGRDNQFGETVRNAWKIYCATREKWFLFYTKTPAEKEMWLQAFKEERMRVKEDIEQGFVVTEEAKKAARLAVHNKLKPKRPRAKLPKGPRPHPDTAVAELLLDPPCPKTRSGSLPSNLNPSLVVAVGARHEPPKKKGSGWFHFGSSKKPKK